MHPLILYFLFQIYFSLFLGKVDYSNQIMITADDWEIDCHQLKFASHIGSGAFGKVVTGYYEDHRVAIKLVRGEFNPVKNWILYIKDEWN